MNEKTFLDHLQEAFDALEGALDFEGTFTDAFEPTKDGVIIPFEDGSRFKLIIEKID